MKNNWMCFFRSFGLNSLQMILYAEGFNFCLSKETCCEGRLSPECKSSSCGSFNGNLVDIWHIFLKLTSSIFCINKGNWSSGHTKTHWDIPKRRSQGFEMASEATFVMSWRSFLFLNKVFSLFWIKEKRAPCTLKISQKAYIAPPKIKEPKRFFEFFGDRIPSTSDGGLVTMWSPQYCVGACRSYPSSLPSGGWSCCQRRTWFAVFFPFHSNKSELVLTCMLNSSRQCSW